MPKGPAEIHDRISIGGIKLSPELAQFSCSCPKNDPNFLTSLLQAIAGQQINIVYFSLTDAGDNFNLSFCIEAVHHPNVVGLFPHFDYQVSQVQHLDSVGTVTIFPHRNSLNLLGRVLATCGADNLSIFGLLTSISALSFTAPYSSLDDTVTKLTTLLDLPDNHAPFRPQSILVNMVETVAVYWEPVIRVYGIDIVKDVALLELTFRPEDCALLGQLLMQFKEEGRGFVMVLLETTATGNLRIYLALRQEVATRFHQQLENFTQKDYTLSARLTEQVEVLFFHGPHFQDRYGIVEALFRSVNQQEITLHLVGCTGTSVYLVVGDGEATRARDMLAGDFVVP
ncbi:hypothetical protein [Desulfopila aestuarii]|uniref:ACT domain-containing protein n=1 Tax=Desulfopila aestuarii DSM 18488 TaxID=1121416 RepID=A0A1M7YA74_9BACT|nr:hypothetical protein [Desulfopila aestuarii]SHO49534.1 hypothetical protein SAMN02745220_02885 [Desulfopila aestuarii DSM 18488]